MDLSTVLAFLMKGVALWVFAGLLTVVVWVCVIVWFQVFVAKDQWSSAQFQRLNEKIKALPGWTQSFADGVQRVTFAVGFSPHVGAIVADVSSFIVGWPWVVGIIAETLYEWWNDRAEE
jgi:hypothetical protein